jgi:prepilin-type N-terminal cleavage/methylation domain-containing protein
VRGERGESLIELLIALAIIGIAMVGIVGAMSTGVIVSDRHRKQAVAGSYVVSYAETVKQAAESAYQASCTPTYGSAHVVPTGYAKSLVSTSFWTGSAFQASCLAAGDTGIQRLTLQVASTDGRASEQLVVIVRRACGPDNTDAACT